MVSILQCGDRWDPSSPGQTICGTCDGWKLNTIPKKKKYIAEGNENITIILLGIFNGLKRPTIIEFPARQKNIL